MGAPWFFIAAIHNMEASLRFDRHLHNGDRLAARTVHVPAERPAEGEPPFTWEESSQGALTMHGIDEIEEWTLPRILYELEPVPVRHAQLQAYGQRDRAPVPGG
ncbi:MAG: hypothetical protein ABFS24_13480 [Pseudomonadota bacterium]